MYFIYHIWRPLTENLSGVQLKDKSIKPYKCYISIHRQLKQKYTVKVEGAPVHFKSIAIQRNSRASTEDGPNHQGDGCNGANQSSTCFFI